MRYINTGQFDKALEIHREIVRLEPTNALALAEIAWILQRREDMKGAKEHWRLGG